MMDPAEMVAEPFLVTAPKEIDSVTCCSIGTTKSRLLKCRFDWQVDADNGLNRARPRRESFSIVNRVLERIYGSP